MGRKTPGSYDDVFLNKLKTAFVQVLDQLNTRNAIPEAFELCPSSSRRDRAVLAFMQHPLAHVHEPSSPDSEPTQINRASSAQTTTSTADDRDSIVSLSANRRQLERSDPNPNLLSQQDSWETSSDATFIQDPPESAQQRRQQPRQHPSLQLPKPDYTFEQLTEHIDPQGKVLHYMIDILIKDTAKRALLNKLSSKSPPTCPDSPPSYISPDLNELITSFRSYIPETRMLMEALSTDIPQSSTIRSTLSTTNLRPRSSIPLSTFSNLGQDASRVGATQSLLGNPARNVDNPSIRTRMMIQRQLQRRLLSSVAGYDSTPLESTNRPRFARDESRDPLLGTNRSLGMRPSTVPLLNTLTHSNPGRNPPPLPTLPTEANSTDVMQSTINALRTSLVELHAELGLMLSTNSVADTSTSSSSTFTNFQNLLMRTIEMFDDTLLRLTLILDLFSTGRDASSHSNQPSSRSQASQQERQAHAAQMRASAWRVRNLVVDGANTLAREMAASARSDGVSTSDSAQTAAAEELMAHRHFVACLEEAHWARNASTPPTPHTIREWRRKLSMWYYLDRDRNLYPDPSQPTDGQVAASIQDQLVHTRWYPQLQVAYAWPPLDQDGPSLDAGIPDPLEHPQEAWLRVRQQQQSTDPTRDSDADLEAALNSESVQTALQTFVAIRSDNVGASTSNQAGESVDAALQPDRADETVSEAGADGSLHNLEAQVAVDPDVSLTRTTSLRRRNAIRGPALYSPSSATSILSSSSASLLRRSSSRVPFPPMEADADTANREQQQRFGRDTESTRQVGDPDLLSSSYVLVASPSAVLGHDRSHRVDSSVVRERPLRRSGIYLQDVGDDGLEGHEASSVLGRRTRDDAESDAELDLDLSLGMADEYDQMLDELQMSPIRRQRRRRLLLQRVDDDEQEESRQGQGHEQEPNREEEIRSGASTPLEARLATFEAYARRSRFQERRRQALETLLNSYGNDEPLERQGG